MQQIPFVHLQLWSTLLGLAIAIAFVLVYFLLIGSEFSLLCRPLLHPIRALRVLIGKMPFVPGPLRRAAGRNWDRRLVSEMELVLRNGETPVDGSPTEYDLEERLLTTSGRLFRTVSVSSTYYPDNLAGNLTDEIATQYVAEAKSFFSNPVGYYSARDTTYEDVEAASLAQRFLTVDRRCYHAVDKFKRTINSNLRKLLLVQSLMLFAGIGILFTLYSLIAEAPASHHFSFIDPVIASSLAASIVLIVVMLLIQFIGFRTRQRENFDGLTVFLTRYLARVEVRYREALDNAKNVTVGSETNLEKLTEAAKKWYAIWNWMPFRVFFIDKYLKNIIYQLQRCRRLSAHILLASSVIVMLFVGATVVGPVVAKVPHAVLFSSHFWMHEGLFVAGFLVLFLVIFGLWWRIAGTIQVGEGAVDGLGFTSFEDLKVSSAMDELVGRYAEELAFWKDHFNRNLVISKSSTTPPASPEPA